MKILTLKIYLITVFFLSISVTSFSQLTVNNSLTPENLVKNVLLGNGIEVSNIKFTGVLSASDGYQICSFTTSGATQTQLGFKNGIFLTSGSTTNISGPVSQVATGYLSSTPNEMRKNKAPSTLLSDMQTLIDGTTNWGNLAVLEFDFIPTSDSVKFRYVFSSTEYSDPSLPPSIPISYNCSDVNDKMAFIIDGPGLSGPFSNNGTNIALIPGTSLPVCINAINNGIVGSSGGSPNKSKCQAANPSWVLGSPTNLFYGTMSGIAFNGNTKIMTARAKVTPCQKYHIRLLVTDVGDFTYDSGIFIEGGSFSSPGVSASAQITDASGAALTNNYITENCSKAVLTFKVDPIPTSDYPITYTLGGSASSPSNTNPDYSIPSNQVSGQLKVLAGQATTQLIITPNVDNTTETDEIIEIQVLGQTTCSGTTLVQTPITITIKDELKVSATSTPPSCSASHTVISDGTITLTTSGGAIPYLFSIDNGGNFSYNTSPISALGNSTYNIKIKDKDGCIASVNTPIVMNTNCTCTTPTLAPTSNNPTTCSGTGTIDLALTNVPDGTYDIKYTKGGIAGTFSSVVVTGNTATIPAVSEGTYNDLTITVSGCTSVTGKNATLTPPNIPTLQPTANAPATCNGSGTIDLVLTNVPNGTYDINYTKGGTAGTFTGVVVTSNTAIIPAVAAGIYNDLKITSAGCTSVSGKNATLTAPGSPTLVPTANNPTTCNGTGTIGLALTNVPDGTYTINYTKGGIAGTFTGVVVTSNTATILTVAPDIYNDLTITSAGCTSVTGKNATLTAPGTPTLQPTANNPSTCNGTGTIGLVLTNVPDGTYTINYTKGGTPGTFTGVVVTSNAATITTVSADTYNDLTITNAGCTSVTGKNAILTAPGSPTLIPTANNPTTCNGTGTIGLLLTNVPDGTYTINYTKGGTPGTFTGIVVTSNAATITTVPAGIYNDLTITSAGCSNLSGANTTLTKPINPIKPTANVLQPTCDLTTGSIEITAPIGSNFSYSKDGNTYQNTPLFNNLNANPNYTIIVKDISTECTTDSIFKIKTPPNKPVKPSAVVTQPTCTVSTGTITVTNPVGINYSYSIDNITFQSSPSFDMQTAGSYTYYVKDTTECYAFNTTNVQAPPILPIASFNYAPIELSTLSSEAVFTNNSINATSFKWVFDDGSKISNVKNPTHLFPGNANDYNVKLTAFNKLCSHDTTVLVTVIEKPIIYVPNSFTPNEDELNNVFVPVIGGGIASENYSMYIFNRWGNLIFESHNKEIGWDGTFGNKPCPADTYIWKIEYRESSGTKSRKQLVGHFNLVN